MENKGFDDNDDLRVRKKHGDEKNNNDGNGVEVSTSSTLLQTISKS